MTASTEEADPSPREMRIDDVLPLLNKALEWIDALGTRPDIGARLQHVIDLISPPDNPVYELD